MIQWQAEEIKNRRPYRFDFVAPITATAHDKLFDMITEEFDCSYEEMISTSHERHIVESRMVMTHVLSTHFGCTQKRIATILKHERSDVVYYLRRSQELIDVDYKFKQIIRRIETKLLNQP